MMSKRHYSPPRQGPRVEIELASLYRRRILLENLIRTLEDYARQPASVGAKARKVA